MGKHEVLEIMGEIIIPNAVERKPGFLYYIDGEGNVCEAKMNQTGRKKNEKRQTSNT